MKIDSGLIILNKPKGITSFQVISRLRRILSLKKMGHGGTLDPDVTGVLPIFLGKSTRLLEYFDESRKIYRVEGRLGIKTDSQDISGNIIARSENYVEMGILEDVVNSFVGEIFQIPPMHSAVHHEGKRLYELAREGIVVERKSRKQTIYWVKNFSYDYPKFSFDVSCSRGTYIRTLIDDIGEKAGTYATMTSLIRLETCGMSIEDSYSLEEIENLVRNSDFSFVLDPSEYLYNIPRLDLDKMHKEDILCGRTFPIEGDVNKLYRVYIEDEFYGIGKVVDNNFKIEKMLYSET